MKLIVDCGATKTDWLSLSGTSIRTPGINLAHTPPERLKTILDQVVEEIGPGITDIYFYAAGLVGESPVDLRKWFPDARVEYASDMLGVARAACGREPGLAAIIGTGANTCQYDGTRISRQIHCGGFIVGDEGSSAVLGRLFITDFLKGYVPGDLAEAFSQKFPSDYPLIVKNIYRSAAPSRYLGSFAPFLLSFYETSEYVRNLVDNNFRAFFERTIKQYEALPVGIIGGYGYACRDILQRIGKEFGVSFSSIEASPLSGLQKYHAV